MVPNSYKTMIAEPGPWVRLTLQPKVIPTYINEVSPTHLRGAFGAIFQHLGSGRCVVSPRLRNQKRQNYKVLQG